VCEARIMKEVVHKMMKEAARGQLKPSSICPVTKLRNLLHCNSSRLIPSQFQDN